MVGPQEGLLNIWQSRAHVEDENGVQRCAVAGSTFEISVGECIGPFLERDGRMQKLPRS